MIKLYDKTGEVLIGELEDCISCNVTEVRNGIFDARLVYPAMRLISNNLIKENIIVCKASDILLNQKFRIFNVKKKHSNTIEVIARHISFDLLYDFIENINIVNQSCEYALNTIFRNSQFSRHYKGHSDIINAQDYNMSMANCLNAIAGKEGSIIDTYGTGAEILRDNENIHVLNRRGHDNSVTIEYGKNLEGFECTEDTTDLITRIYPFVKKSTPDGETTITLNEKFVDSPRINLYSHPYIREVDLTSKFKDEDEINQAKLKLEAEKYFLETKCDIPKLTFNLKPVPLSKCVGFENLGEKLSLCDIATIKHKIYGITTQAKVIKTVFNVLTDRYENIQLGDPKASLGDLIGGNSGNTPQVGPPGPPGPPGQDGNIGDFPDSLPAIPQLTANVLGFASVDLSWTYENKVYYNYQVFASKTENFEPNMFDLIFEGQASSFLHQVKTDETWYYRARAVNTHGKATELSTQVKVTTKKVDDFENYFSSMAIQNLVAGIFTVDYMTAGIVKGNWIDAKNLSVTDGNGKRTLDINSAGNVNLDVNSLNIRGSKVISEKDTLINIKAEISNYKTTVDSAFEDVDTAYEKLVNEMNGAFRDGILTEAEKQNLKDQLLNLESEKDSLIKEIDELINNKYLQNTNQLVELIDAKRDFIYRFYTLINAIRGEIGEPPLVIPEIPGIDIFRDVTIHFPHFSDKFNPAYPDISLIENHNGEVYLFDGGEKVSQYEVERYLKSKNINKVDKIFITHSHSDHIESMPYLLEKFGCKEMYLRTPEWESLDHWETVWKTRELHEAMVAKATEIGARIIEISDDITINLTEKSNIKVFNSRNTAWGNYNNVSLGYLFNYTAKDGTVRKIFIQSDMSYQAEDFVGGQNVGKVDIFKMGHHGNVSSNSETWLSHLRPTYSVATLGYPRGNQVKLNTMRCMFVSSKVFLPNDNPNFMSISINKDNGKISTNAYEHKFYCEWYQRDNGDWYYFKSDGNWAMDESLIINGLRYHFDTNGLCTNPGGEAIE
ncbi:phage tail spike protein (plasmid) [Clostridium perfringens]|uniref:phage tail spike protein n=1 Tax=Clostridium perfringens TaxID=1502 RepID=UPI0030CED15F